MKKLHKMDILIKIIINCAINNNRYIYIDFQTIIQLQDKIKIANYVKAQTTNIEDFEYKNKKYKKTNEASL